MTLLTVERTSKDIVQYSRLSDSVCNNGEHTAATFTSNTVQQEPSKKSKKAQKQKTSVKPVKKFTAASIVTLGSDSEDDQNTTSRPSQSSAVWK